MALPRVLIIHPALAPYRIDLFNALALRLDLKIVFLNEDVPNQTYDQTELRRRLNAVFLQNPAHFNSG
jgi:ABC-type phosphate transport system ATPase subunit